MKLFSGLKIENKAKFSILTVVYLLVLAVYLTGCRMGVLTDATLMQTIFGWFLGLFPNAFYTGPIIHIVWMVISFPLVLFLAWQTNFKEQKLNRLVLFLEAINVLFAFIALGLTNGFGILVVSLLVVAVLCGGGAGIALLVMKKNGTLDYSDVLTEEEIRELNEKKK